LHCGLSLNAARRTSTPAVQYRSMTPWIAEARYSRYRDR
jgi:hypothetical protein